MAARAHRVLRRFMGRRVLRRFVLAMEFPNQEARQRYMQKHPKADPAKHWVKGDRPDAPVSNEPSPEGAEPKADKPTPKKRAPKPKRTRVTYTTDTHPLRAGQKLKVARRHPIGDGVNGAEFLDIVTEDGTKHTGIWKSEDNERGAGVEFEEKHGNPLRAYIKYGTYFEREGVVSDVDDIFGGKRVVPHTFTQTVDGERGSLQEYVPGTKSSSSVFNQIGGSDDPIAEVKKLASSFQLKKMTFMDLINANDDRHSENALWEKDDQYGFVPHAIDNGLAFPAGDACRFLFPLGDPTFKHEAVKANDEIKECLQKFDIEKLAQKLKEMRKLEPRAKLRTLARAQALKNDPDLPSKEADKVLNHRWRTIDDQMFEWVNKPSHQRVEDGELTQEQLDHIMKLADADDNTENEE